MEHTTDREMAKEITMDHLFEDPQYYTKLATVEEYVDDKGVEHVAAALPQTEEEPIKEGEDSEETLEGLKEMAMGDLERIADYANMILERMGQGQNLDSWMYSQITLAVDQLNSVHDTMDGTDGKKEEVKEGKINELTGNERQIKNGNPNNIFYIFYKGQFAAEYWAMNPHDLYKIYWHKFKVRKAASSKSGLNPEFIIVPKKEYDNSTSNRYAKLKPYVDKFWDKLQNESVNEAKVIDIIDRFEHLKLPDVVYLNKKPYTGNAFVMNGYNGYTSSDDDGWVYDSKTRKPLTDKQGNTLRATTHRGAKWDFKDGIRESVNEEIKIQAKPEHWNERSHTILVTTAPNKTYVLRFNNKNDSSPFSVTFPGSMGTKPIDNNKSAREFWLKVKGDVVKWRSTNESVNEGTNEEWAGLDTIKRGGYGSSRLQNGDKIRMVIDARKNKYYNGVINGSSIKWEDGAKSELSLSTQASNRGDLQVLRPTTKNESVNENLDNYSKDAITDMIINLSRYEGNEKLIADLKKILKQRTLGKLKKEQSVNEATESDIIAQIKNIAKTHQNNIVVDPKSGKKMRVDAFSASAIATVYDALSDSSKEKFLASGLLGMQQMAMKLLKK